MVTGLQAGLICVQVICELLLRNDIYMHLVFLILPRLPCFRKFQKESYHIDLSCQMNIKYCLKNTRTLFYLASCLFVQNSLVTMSWETILCTKVFFVPFNFCPSTLANGFPYLEFIQTQLCLKGESLRHLNFTTLKFTC